MDNHTDKPIRVRIVKCDDIAWWYSDEIGKEFIVTKSAINPDYILVANSEYEIKREDCEVISEPGNNKKTTAEEIIRKGIEVYNSNASDLHKFQFTKGEMKFFCELFEQYAALRIAEEIEKAGDRLPSNDDLTARFTTRTPNGSYLIGHRDIEVAKWMKCSPQSFMTSSYRPVNK